MTPENAHVCINQTNNSIFLHACQFCDFLLIVKNELNPASILMMIKTEMGIYLQLRLTCKQLWCKLFTKL